MKKIIPLILLVFLSSCENEPPYIRNPVYNILVYEGGGIAGSSISVYLSIHFVLFDENGFDDILEVEVVNTDDDTVWRVPKTNLEQTEWGDETYYGYSFFEIDNGMKVKLGNYIVKVRDKSGNESEMAFPVDIQGVTTKEFVPSIPEYQIKLKDNKKELDVTGANYSSIEVKFLNKPDKYKNGRKKFNYGEKIILSDKEISTGNVISVRFNSDKDERLVYFLKNFNI